jgi:hypothetical protein
MLNDRWNQARNLIMQQVQILLEEMSKLQDTNDRVLRANKEFDQVNAELRSNPPVGSVGAYQKRMSDMQGEIYRLRDELNTWKHYGKLKDRAKMRVEATRDAYHQAMKIQQKTIDELRLRPRLNLSLEAQNQRQALAYEDMRRENADLQRRNTLLEEKVNALKQILDMGIAGLRYEDQKRRNEGQGW